MATIFKYNDEFRQKVLKDAKEYHSIEDWLKNIVFQQF